MVPMRWLESIALQHKLGILKTVCLEIIRKQEEIYPSAIIEHKRKASVSTMSGLKRSNHPPQNRDCLIKPIRDSTPVIEFMVYAYKAFT